MMLILAPIDDHSLYSNGHTFARPGTMSVVEHPRKRPITLPVIRVRVEVSPALLVGAPSRSFLKQSTLVLEVQPYLLALFLAFRGFFSPSFWAILGVEVRFKHIFGAY